MFGNLGQGGSKNCALVVGERCVAGRQNPVPWDIIGSCISGAVDLLMLALFECRTILEGSGTFDNPSVKCSGFELSTELLWFPL